MAIISMWGIFIGLSVNVPNMDFNTVCGSISLAEK
jgi:hypothetical protein